MHLPLFRAPFKPRPVSFHSSTSSLEIFSHIANPIPWPVFLRYDKQIKDCHLLLSRKNSHCIIPTHVSRPVPTCVQSLCKRSRLVWQKDGKSQKKTGVRQSNRTGTNDAKSMNLCLGIFVGLISDFDSGNSFCVRSRGGTDIDCWTGLQGWKRTKNTCSSVHSPSNVQEKTTSRVDTKYVLINRFF